jgi:hypothetical protein
LTQELINYILILSYDKEASMQEFPVDEEVLKIVWQRANPRPFESLSFNAALRRVLGMSEDARGNMPRAANDASSPSPTPTPDVIEELLTEVRSRAKAAKADIRELVRAGLLRNGEELFLVDYHGAPLQQFKATISSGGLQFKSQHYSMSQLACDLLKKVGYQSDSVRGPAHWANSKGVTVKDLWQQLLDRRSKK